MINFYKKYINVIVVCLLFLLICNFGESRKQLSPISLNGGKFSIVSSDLHSTKQKDPIVFIDVDNVIETNCLHFLKQSHHFLKYNQVDFLEFQNLEQNLINNQNKILQKNYL